MVGCGSGKSDLGFVVNRILLVHFHTLAESDGEALYLVLCRNGKVGVDIIKLLVPSCELVAFAYRVSRCRGIAAFGYLLSLEVLAVVVNEADGEHIGFNLLEYCSQFHSALHYQGARVFCSLVRPSCEQPALVGGDGECQFGVVRHLVKVNGRLDGYLTVVGCQFHCKL